MTAWRELECNFHISLKETLFCGQVFHFTQILENYFIGTLSNQPIILEQRNQKIYFLETAPSVKAVLQSFFNLDITLPSQITYDGVRFITNDLHIAIFSFICSSNNNVKRISKMVKFMFSLGEEIDLNPIVALLSDESDSELKKILLETQIYRFPTLEKLIGIEDYLVQNKFGYRAKFVSRAAKLLHNESIDWSILSCDQARKHLMRMPGIGRKIADCICLTALRFFQVVPLDVHLIRHSFKEFGLQPSKTLTDEQYSKIQSAWISKYGEYAGIQQLYVFKNSIR